MIKSPEGSSAVGPLGEFPAVAISPDGTEIAYVAASGETAQVFLRALDRLEPQPLSGAANATSPFFSPDGQWLGFFADGKLKKVSLHGGEPATLCEAPVNRGGAWGPDNTIVFAPDLFGGLMRVSAAGGSPEVLATPDTSKGEDTYRWPEILPDGKALLFVIARHTDIGSFSESKIAVERLDRHEKKILPIRGTYPRYSPTGHVLFSREGTVFAVPFDVNRLEVTGPAVPVLDRVKVSPLNGVIDFVVSETGSLAYVPENAPASKGFLVWMDRKGQISGLAAPARDYDSPHISPDGKRVAVSISSGNDKADVWLYEIAHVTLTRLTFDEQSFAPIWSPDGKHIAFASGRPGQGWAIRMKPADGSGAEETLVSGEDFQLPTSWSPDGKFLAYWTGAVRAQANQRPAGIWILPLQGERKPQPFHQTKFDELDATFSPDGRWVAYMSDESGRNEVYVRPFPGPGSKFQISTDGGEGPAWAHNGHELLYGNLTKSAAKIKLMSVGVTTQPSFSASIPRIFMEVPREARLDCDVSPDGQRFLCVKASVESGPPDEVRVVVNWTEELKQLLAPPGKRP